MKTMMNVKPTSFLTEYFTKTPLIIANTVSNTSTNNKFKEREVFSSTISKSLLENTYYLEDDITSDFDSDGDFIQLTQTPNLSIQTNICIYKINKTYSNKPFVQYLFSTREVNKEEETMEFPNYSIDFTNLTNTPVKTYIMNEIIPHVLDILSLHSIFDENIFKKIFKGFVYKEKNLYLFFQYDESYNTFDVKEMKENKDKYKWAIMDEILYIQSICGKKIDYNIHLLFKETPFLQKIYVNTNKNIEIDIPLLLYLCKKNKDKIVNCEIKEDDSIISFPFTFKHPFLGDFYYFTSQPLFISQNTIEQKNQMEQLERYAVFTNLNMENIEDYFGEENEIYLTKNIDEISNEQKQVFIERLNQTDTITIYFKEKDIQYWCIKTPNQFVCIS